MADNCDVMEDGIPSVHLTLNVAAVLSDQSWAAAAAEEYLVDGECAGGDEDVERVGAQVVEWEMLADRYARAFEAAVVGRAAELGVTATVSISTDPELSARLTGEPSESDSIAHELWAKGSKAAAEAVR